MTNNHPVPLTDREFEVLKLMVQGLHNQEIAEKLNITQKTVDFHVANIIQKMGVENRVQAVVEAIRREWVKI